MDYILKESVESVGALGGHFLCQVLAGHNHGPGRSCILGTGMVEAKLSLCLHCGPSLSSMVLLMWHRPEEVLNCRLGMGGFELDPRT